jgi:hypothetical protein
VNAEVFIISSFDLAMTAICIEVNETVDSQPSKVLRDAEKFQGK